MDKQFIIIAIETNGVTCQENTLSEETLTEVDLAIK